MASFKIILNRLFPGLLILTCIAVLSLFFIDPFKYAIQNDDYIFIFLLKTHSISESISFVMATYNGRWFSHFYTFLVFSVLGANWSFYFIYDLFIFLLLVLSFHSFFTLFIKKGIISELSFFKKTLLSFFIASIFFIFLLDGRYEVFYWISSISNHLLSIIFFLFSLSLFVSEYSFFRTFLLGVLCFCLGQMNEVYAVNYLFILFFIALTIPKTKIYFIIALIALSSGLLINVFTIGSSIRYYHAATEFDFLKSVKDFTYTFLLPIINFRYLPIKLSGLILLFLAIRDYFKIRVYLPGKLFFAFNRFLAIACALSIFAQCYLLRDVCQYRGLLLYCLTLLYFIFIMASKNMLNPLKLFFK